MSVYCSAAAWMPPSLPPSNGYSFQAPGMHPANVLVTAMNAVGVATSTLDEVAGRFPACAAEAERH